MPGYGNVKDLVLGLVLDMHNIQLHIYKNELQMAINTIIYNYICNAFLHISGQF